MDSSLFIVIAVLLLLALCWFGLHYYLNQSITTYDAHARVTGNCGDTMEIGLKIVDGRVAGSSHSSDGCSISRQCIEGAALLSGGKTIQEVKRLNMIDIMELVGQLPQTHLHCAQLAETTLQVAIKRYENRSELQKSVSKL